MYVTRVVNKDFLFSRFGLSHLMIRVLRVFVSSVVFCLVIIVGGVGNMISLCI